MILILDFGSQYTQLIARRVRELHVYCEIHPFDVPLDVDPAARRRRASSSRAARRASTTRTRRMPRPEVLELLRAGTPPVLGICYGMNVLNLAFGGEVGARRAQGVRPGRRPHHAHRPAARRSAAARPGSG